MDGTNFSRDLSGLRAKIHFLGLAGINSIHSRMMANIIAAEALAGMDSFCMNYLKAFRAGVFK